MAVGMTEVLLILIVVLILFGPKRLPELARAIGQSVKEYRKTVNSEDKPKKSSKELKG
ncbi:MAG: twin-arginine translocase TatA/TatE family subunit [Candidatus Woesearchaeota archaeon]